MLKKVTTIVLPAQGTGRIRGINSNRNREFFVGTDCDGTFGGGKITSMVEDTERHAIVITKGSRFAGPMDGSGNREIFDEICVPTANTAYWTVQYEKTEDPPAAKPVQNQQQGQQQRR